MSIYNSADFDEQILAHLARSPEVFERARKLKLEGDDFLTSHGAGIELYKHMGETILAMGVSPLIPRGLLEIELNDKFEKGIITGVDGDTVTTLLDWMYTCDLNKDYVCLHLLPFIKHRRLSKVQQNTAGSVDLYNEMHRVASELEADVHDEDIIDVHPFDRPIFIDEMAFRDTGFDGLTEAMGGFQPEECSLLLGASGSGKTSVATNLATAISTGHNVLYVSLEEPTSHLVQRFYSNKFQINYTGLRYGKADEKALLQTAFNDLTAPERAAMRRLRLADARKQVPITIKGIMTLLEKYAAEGFIVDTVIIDQMDYMGPLKAVPKGADRWKEYEQIAFECDELSMYKIAEIHPISVIVLHQLKGSPKWKFGYEDISGFKGIVKPFDNAIAVGRLPETPHINLQSLKVRHSAPFCLTYMADFSIMSFFAEVFTPPDEKDGKEKKGRDYTVNKKKEDFNEKEARLLKAAKELKA